MESSTRHLRFQLYTQDESHIIEDAVNTAIHALLDAIHSVNCDKIVKYQSVVEERDKEISRLEYKLRQNELELRVVRGQRDGYRRLAAEGQGPEQAEDQEGTDRYEVPAEDDAMTNGLTARTDFPSGSSDRPPSLHLTAPLSPHKRSDRRGRSSSSSPWEPPDAGANPPGDRYAARPPGPPVKEEPSGCEAFFIKLEMCEQSCGGSPQDEQQHPDLHPEGSSHSRRLSDAERNKRYRQRCRSTPEGLLACREKERIRYLKRRVLVAEMSEDARRRKREMWRAAARRHRDRKMGGLLPHCPPEGGDLFDDWPALGDAESDRDA